MDNQPVKSDVNLQSIQRIKCDTSNALCVLVIWKQPSF